LLKLLTFSKESGEKIWYICIKVGSKFDRRVLFNFIDTGPAICGFKLVTVNKGVAAVCWAKTAVKTWSRGFAREIEKVWFGEPGGIKIVRLEGVLEITEAVTSCDFEIISKVKYGLGHFSGNPLPTNDKYPPFTDPV